MLRGGQDFLEFGLKRIADMVALSSAKSRLMFSKSL